jgi:uncharacterized protein DUF1203
MPALRFSALPQPLVDEARSAALAAGTAVVPADDDMPFPVRCCLSDETRADRVLLVSVQPPVADSPYTARSPVYVHRQACPGRPVGSPIPEILATRRLSLRAYDERHMITGSAVVDGADVERAAAGLLDDDRAAYVHVHFAAPGCYACRIDRA